MDFFISGGEGGIIPAITKYYWLALIIINQQNVENKERK